MTRALREFVCGVCGLVGVNRRKEPRFCSRRCVALGTKPTVIPRTEWAAVVSRYSSGRSTTEIAAEYGCDPEAVRLILVRKGQARRRGGGPRRPIGTRWTDPRGYVWVKVGSDNDATVPGRAGWILEHRLVKETALGRSLLSSEHVHHKDGNRANNALSNLEVLTRSQHGKEHHGVSDSTRAEVRRLYAAGVEIADIKRSTGVSNGVLYQSVCGLPARGKRGPQKRTGRQ